MSHSTRHKNRRERLFDENPHCYYCGVLTVLSRQDGGKLRDDSATIEHLYPKLHPRRRVPNTTGERRLVLACNKCNNQKSVRDQVDYLGIGGARLRSMGPKNWEGWAISVIKDLNRFDCW